MKLFGVHCERVGRAEAQVVSMLTWSAVNTILLPNASATSAATVPYSGAPIASSPYTLTFPSTCPVLSGGPLSILSPSPLHLTLYTLHLSLIAHSAIGAIFKPQAIFKAEGRSSNRVIFKGSARSAALLPTSTPYTAPFPSGRGWG